MNLGELFPNGFIAKFTWTTKKETGVSQPKINLYDAKTNEFKGALVFNEKSEKDQIIVWASILLNDLNATRSEE